MGLYNRAPFKGYYIEFYDSVPSREGLELLEGRILGYFKGSFGFPREPNTLYYDLSYIP